MPQCYKCFLIINTFDQLFLHIKVYHPHDTTPFKCLEINCHRVFDSLKSFKKHTRVHSNNPINIHCVSTFSPNQPTNSVQPVEIEPNIFPAVEISTKNNQIEDFELSVYNKALCLLSKWYGESGVPRNKIQLIIDDFTDFINDFLPQFKNEVLNTLTKFQPPGGDIILSNISSMFDVMCNPFKNLKTEHKRFKVLDEMGMLIRPKTIHVGNRMNDKLQNGCVIAENIPINIYSVPLPILFKRFFELPNVYNTMITYTNKLLKDTNIVYNYIQSESWREKIELHPNKTLFPFLLYFDEFETNNPLGSHRGVQKLGAVYISMPSFPPELISKLESIFLVLLFNSIDKKQVGNTEIFKNLISEIKDLEENGIEVFINDESIKVYFCLALIVGDNLGLHGMMGFSESFVANYPCRFCLCSKTVCHKQLFQIDNELRNTENYEIDVNTENMSETGIVERSIWNTIPSFHVVNNYSVDLMHDILEGVCGYDIFSILRHFIFVMKYFTLETLNHRIKFFNYGTTDIRNRPPLLLENTLKSNSNTIKMSASEMWNFVRYLGLLIGDLVDVESEYWCLYILLKKILDIVTSNCIGPECPSLLELLISEHNDLYLKLTKLNLKPKFHHLIHYPMVMRKVGPLINIWSMRFEAKHKESKTAAAAISSRKNICYTLVLKSQLKMSHQFYHKTNFDFSNLSHVGKVLNITSTIKENLSITLNNPDIYKSQFVSWINFKGTRYTNNNMCIVIDMCDETNSLPVYGSLKYLCVSSDMQPLTICMLFETVGFDDRFQAYCVKKTSTMISIQFNEIPYIRPTFVCIKNNSCFIP